MAHRSFTGSAATMKQDQLADKFENMLNRVDRMIKSDSAYSVWIRLTIGKNKDTQLVFDTSSQAKDENLVMSLDYKKSGAGTANEFTFKVAVDLFDYGQTTKKRVEQLDELLFNAMNVTSLDSAEDIFYCKFQYGYNVAGDTQIVSPQYEGIITDILPSIDYTNGKTYYTIKGTSFVKDTGFSYTFNAIGDPETGNGGWNGLDLVLWILWYYHGNNETVDMLYDSGYKNNLTNHSDDWNWGIADRFNIDIPGDLAKSASTVILDQVSDMSAIDYCKYVLERTRNTADPRYNKEKNDYDLKEGETRPKYVLYLTDSGANGYGTIHVAYIGSNEDLTKLAGIRTINFNFEWFNRNNNIVLKWNPEVKLMAYFVARAQQKRNEMLERMEETRKQRVEAATKSRDEAAKELQDLIKQSMVQGPKFYESSKYTKEERDQFAAAEKAKFLEALTSIKEILTSSATILMENAKEILYQVHEVDEEFYNSTITLVGIPSDIPLNIMLKIKPKILESVSRTQGTYYVTGATDSINTNGLFTTTIDLFRYSKV